MKLPFTNTFLLGLYEIAIQPLGDMFSLFPKNMIEAVNPELFQMRRTWRKERNKRDFRQMVYYLKKNGYIKTSRQKAILITPKGAKKALMARLHNKQQKPRKDGKWIMLIFDIPEKQRRLRDMLRDFLIAMKYQKLQQSVWICPYEVFEETEALTKEYGLEKYTRIFLLDEIAL